MSASCALFKDAPQVVLPDYLGEGTLIFRWWISVLQTAAPRIASSPSAQSDFIAYTDAAASTKLMGALPFGGHQLGYQTVVGAFAPSSPPLWIRSFLATNEIFWMELLDQVVFVRAESFQIKGRRIAIYIDNSASLSALILGIHSPASPQRWWKFPGAQLASTTSRSD